MVHVFVQGRMYNVAVIVERIFDIGLVGDIIHHGKTTVGFGPHSQAIALAAAAIMVVAVTVAAYVTWRFIEMPALAWTKRVVGRIGARRAGMPAAS